jgi:hypothetical protein
VVATVALCGLAVGGLGACQPAGRPLGLAASAGAVALVRSNREAAVGGAPAASPVVLPALPASADPAAIAAGNALWALWFDDPTYADKLNVLIPIVAWRAAVSVPDLTAAWTSAEKRRMIVVLSALTQLGLPYRRYSMVQGRSFDCSGLTSWAWMQVGVDLPRQSLRQIRLVNPRTVESTLPGDLLYFPGHVMLAIGVGSAMIHAPYTGSRIEVRPMWGSRIKSLKVGSPLV